MYAEKGGDGRRVGLHHTDSLAVWAYPGGPVTYAPRVLFETLFTDLKAAGATPTKFLLFLAAVAAVFTNFSPAVTGCGGFVTHFPISPRIQAR